MKFIQFKKFDTLKPYQKLIRIVAPSTLLFMTILTIVYSLYVVDEQELKAKTQHFELYSTKKDYVVSEAILDELEYSYEQFYTLMAFEGQPKKVKLRVFPSVESYQAFMMPLLPKWRDSYTGFATAEGKEIKVISPLAKDAPDYDENEFLKVCQYQLALDLLNQNRYSIEKEPMWLTQGLGMYLSTPKDDPETLKTIKAIIAETPMPDFIDVLSMPQGRAALYNQSVDVFGEQHGDVFSYLLIQFIIEKKDDSLLSSIYKEPESYLTLLGYENEDALIQDFKNYLKTQL